MRAGPLQVLPGLTHIAPTPDHAGSGLEVIILSINGLAASKRIPI
jgi:hypothetical protein